MGKFKPVPAEPFAASGFGLVGFLVAFVVVVICYCGSDLWSSVGLEAWQ